MAPRPRRAVLAAATLLLVAAATLAGTPTVGVAAPPPDDPVITAAGDLVCQSYSQSDGEGACRSDEVADLVRSIAPDAWLPLGDIQYSNGTLTEFQKVYDLQFGDLLPITFPVRSEERRVGKEGSCEVAAD